jgi:hypothetical protein
MKKKDTSNYMKSKSKAQIFVYLKFIAYFEDNTGNSWNSIEKQKLRNKEYKEEIRIKVIELKLNEK